MDVTVNGQARQVPEGTTAEQLLQQLAVRKELVVVEVNLNIVKRDQLEATALKPGDQIEIVRLVGGGA